MTFELKPRKPLLALLMSFLLPGLGQLYNGEINKAIWVFLIFSIVGIPVMAVIALHLPGQLMIFALVASLLLTLLAWGYAMYDAWREARRRQDYRLKEWQISSLYPLVFVLCSVLTLPLVIRYARLHQVESFRIPAVSMEPTVRKGDFIFADKRYNCLDCKAGIQRGDIAIFVNPNNRNIRFIKRIVGLPGERVRISGTDVRINGRLLTQRSNETATGVEVTEGDGTRQWQVLWRKDGARLDDTDVVVPSGQVFVLGDNRRMSHDSRIFGVVPMMDVIGKARQVWFSYDEGIRWERMGMLLH